MAETEPRTGFARPLRAFLATEAAGGAALLLAAVAALAWANSPWQGGYHALFETDIGVGIGRWALDMSLHHWINDAAMTLFFLVVGLEIKRGLVHGELRDIRAAAVPLIDAVGGMPVFFAQHRLQCRPRGRPRVGRPRGHRHRVRRRDERSAVVTDWSDELDRDPTPGELNQPWYLAGSALSPVERIEHRLQRWTSFAIAPAFALANVGVRFADNSLSGPGTTRIALGAGLGLVLGKLLGATAAVYLAVRSGIGRLPAGVRWLHVVGGGCIAGIGFTVRSVASAAAGALWLSWTWLSMVVRRAYRPSPLPANSTYWPGVASGRLGPLEPVRSFRRCSSARGPWVAAATYRAASHGDGRRDPARVDSPPPRQRCGGRGRCHVDAA